MSENVESVKEKKPLRGTRKKFLVVIGASSLVIVAMVVLFFSLGGTSNKQAEADGEKKEDAAKEDVGEIYTLDPFIVNIDDKEEIRYLKVKVEFGVKGKGVKEGLDARKAPLRDAILVLLTTKRFNDIQDLNGKNKLREEILTAANRIVPPGTVSKVYFTDFVIQ